MVDVSLGIDMWKQLLWKQESAREIFSKQFKDYKDNIFELVYDKIKGDKMSEDLNILRQLAGLSVSEDAPIEFKSQLKWNQ